MSARQADSIRHRRARFRDAIASTRRAWPGCAPFSNCPAAAPQYEQSGIHQLLESPGGDPKAREELCAMFRLACGELTALEEDLGSAYRQRLTRDLHRYIDACFASLCHAHLGRTPDDPRYDQYLRDMIAAITAATGGDGSDRGAPGLLASLDRVRSAMHHPPGNTGTQAPGDTCHGTPEGNGLFGTARSLPAEQ